MITMFYTLGSIVVKPGSFTSVVALLLFGIEAFIDLPLYYRILKNLHQHLLLMVRRAEFFLHE